MIKKRIPRGNGCIPGKYRRAVFIYGKGESLNESLITERLVLIFAILPRVFSSSSPCSSRWLFSARTISFSSLNPVMIAGILTMTLLSYDERDHWTQYSGTLPFTRAELVSCKYLIGLCFFGITFLATLTAVGIQMAGKRELFVFRSFFRCRRSFHLRLTRAIHSFALCLSVWRGKRADRLLHYPCGMICAVGTVLAGLGFQTVFPSDKIRISLADGICRGGSVPDFMATFHTFLPKTGSCKARYSSWPLRRSLSPFGKTAGRKRKTFFAVLKITGRIAVNAF